MFLNAHRCLEDGVEPQSERAWLFKIAEHVVMYRWRTISRRARVEFPVDVDALADLIVAPDQEAPELRGLPDALARIPEAQQRAIVLREWYGLSYREVAAELGLSVSATETLIFRARCRLAQELGGPAPTARRRTPLSLASPLASLKWLLGGGTSLKALVGVTSVAVLAVGSARVGLLPYPASPAAPASAQRVLALPAVPASRHVVLLRASAAAGAPARKARASAPRDSTPAAAQPAAAPLLVTADPAPVAEPAEPSPPAPAPEQALPASDQAPPEQAPQEAASPAADSPAADSPAADSPAAVEAAQQPPPTAPVVEPPAATGVAVASQPSAVDTVDTAAGEPVDTTASDPGQSGDLHGPNEHAAFGQAQRSENVPATAADPGSQGHGVPGGAPGGPAGPPAAGRGGPQDNGNNGNHGNGNNGNGNNGNGNAQPPAAAPDPTTQPGQSGGGQPPPQAQGVPAVPPAHEPSSPHGQGNGSAGRDVPDLGSAVAV